MVFENIGKTPRKYHNWVEAFRGNQLLNQYFAIFTVLNRVQHICFLVNTAKFSRKSFSKNICERLLLEIGNLWTNFRENIRSSRLQVTARMNLLQVLFLPKYWKWTPSLAFSKTFFSEAKIHNTYKRIL